jgi:hypothetical protein
LQGRPSDSPVPSTCEGLEVIGTTVACRVNKSISAWKNLAQASSSTDEGSQGPPPYVSNPSSRNVYMIKGDAYISTRVHDYGMPNTTEKGKEDENPPLHLHIENTLGKTMTHIPKVAFKKYSHIPNTRVAQNYSVVEDLSQTPCAMSSLEVLQSYPS